MSDTSPLRNRVNPLDFARFAAFDFTRFAASTRRFASYESPELSLPANQNSLECHNVKSDEVKWPLTCLKFSILSIRLDNILILRLKENTIQYLVEKKVVKAVNKTPAPPGCRPYRLSPQSLQLKSKLLIQISDIIQRLVLPISKWLGLDPQQMPESTRMSQNIVIPTVSHDINSGLIRFDNQKMTAVLTLISFWQMRFSKAVWR